MRLSPQTTACTCTHALLNWEYLHKRSKQIHTMEAYLTNIVLSVTSWSTWRESYGTGVPFQKKVILKDGRINGTFIFNRSLVANPIHWWFIDIFDSWLEQNLCVQTVWRVDILVFPSTNWRWASIMSFTEESELFTDLSGWKYEQLGGYSSITWRPLNY